jgi:hypothetical protein
MGRHAEARQDVYRVAPVTVDNERVRHRRNDIGGPGLGVGANLIRVEFLTLALLLNHVVYK